MTTETTLDSLVLSRETLRTLNSRFKEWDDPLSLKIHKWCRKVLGCPLSGDLMTDERWRVASQEKINKLVTQLLINSVDRAPLKEPVLVRRFILEPWMIHECNLLIEVFPVDGEPLLGGKEHLFAKEMARWAEAHKTFSERSRVTYLLPLSEAELEDADACMLRAAILVQQSFQTEGLLLEKEMQKGLKALDKRQKEQTAALKEELEREKQKRMAAYEQSAAELAAKLQQIEALQEAERVVLKAKLAGVEAEVEELSHDIARKSEEVASLQDETQRLREELAWRARQVHDLQNSRRGGGGGCSVM